MVNIPPPARSIPAIPKATPPPRGHHGVYPSLAMSLTGIARVNAIAPGWIDTTGHTYQGTTPGNTPYTAWAPNDIVQAVLFCARKTAVYTGQTLVVDGGMSARMIYHGDEGGSWAELRLQISRPSTVCSAVGSLAVI